MPISCTQCGRALDAQALELGACRYCGHAIADVGTISISDAGATGTDNPPTGAAPFYDPAQSRYDWKDWPTTYGLPPGAAPPTPPKPGGFPDDAALGGTTTSNALTLPGTGFFTSPADSPPGAAPPGAGLPPLAGTPPFGANAQPISPAQPYYPPPKAPGRRGNGRLLALVGLVLILLVVLIGGGLLLAHSLNKPSAGSSPTGVSVVSTAPPTVTPTARPTTMPTAQPTTTVTPAPTATPTLPSLQTYRDPGGLFTIGYPNGWTSGNVSLPIVPGFALNGVQFQNSMARFTIATGQEPIVAIPPDQVDTLLLASLGVSSPSGAQAVTIGGRKWTQKSGDNNQGRHTVVVSINLNGRLYSIVYSAPTGEFASDNMQAFSPMIASFRFGG